jgi:CRP-like cAMP-binding protein
MLEPSPASNRMLAALPEAELRSLERMLQGVRLLPGKELHQRDEEPAHMYFPASGIISLLYANDRGATTGLALIGYEGAVGLSIVLGDRLPGIHAVVQTAGYAYALSSAETRASFDHSAAFRQLLLRFVGSVSVRMSQTAVCNLHHSVQQRLGRWLLLCMDRMSGNEIHMTHETIAAMLGVRRQGVTEAAKQLERRGIMKYFRGHITVLDREALERSSCECYAALRRETDDLSHVNHAAIAPLSRPFPTPYRGCG